MAGACFYCFDPNARWERWSIGGESWTDARPLGTTLRDLLSFLYGPLCMVSRREGVPVREVLSEYEGVFPESADPITERVVAGLSPMLVDRLYFQPRVEDVVRFEKVAHALRMISATTRSGRYSNPAEAFRARCAEKAGLHLEIQRTSEGQAMVAKLMELAEAVSKSYEIDVENLETEGGGSLARDGESAAARARRNADAISLPRFDYRADQSRLIGKESPFGELIEGYFKPILIEADKRRADSARTYGECSRNEAYDFFTRILDMAVHFNQKGSIRKKDKGLAEALKMEHRANSSCYRAESVAEALLVVAYAYIASGGRVFVCRECGLPFVKGWGDPKMSYCSDTCRGKAEKREKTLPRPGSISSNIRKKANAKCSDATPEIRQRLHDLADLVSAVGPLYRKHCPESLYREWLKCAATFSRKDVAILIEKDIPGPYPVIWHDEFICHADSEAAKAVKADVEAYMAKTIDSETKERKEHKPGKSRGTYRRKMLPSELRGIVESDTTVILAAIEGNCFKEKYFRSGMKKHEAPRVVERLSDSSSDEMNDPMHLLFDERDVHHLAKLIIDESGCKVSAAGSNALRSLVLTILFLYCEHHDVFGLNSARTHRLGEDFSLRNAAGLLSGKFEGNGPDRIRSLEIMRGSLSVFVDGVEYCKEAHRMVASQNWKPHKESRTNDHWLEFSSYGLSVQTEALDACTRAFEHASEPPVRENLFAEMLDLHMNERHWESHTVYYKATGGFGAGEDTIGSLCESIPSGVDGAQARKHGQDAPSRER